MNGPQPIGSHPLRAALPPPKTVCLVASILLVVKHAQLDAHNAALMVTVARETDTSSMEAIGPMRSARGATAGGDSRKLRGIPAIGRSVAGAIPGTVPDGITRR